MQAQSTALIHDWLTCSAGAERVLEAIWELYPGPVHTLIAEPENLTSLSFAKEKIYPSFISKLPFAKKGFRNYLPLFPLAIERFDLSNYKLILSSSHAVAKNVKKRPDQLHICYCHTPMRYAWDLYPTYMSHLKGAKKALASRILPRLRNWDAKSSERVDHFIANSHFVAERIKSNYGREATVIYPPVNTHLFIPSSERTDTYITYSRLVPYKRVDLIVEAFRKLPDRQLTIIGDGPERKMLEAIAPKNVKLLYNVSDERLRKELSSARAFLFAAEEDFGIAPVEAQAAGLPVIAFGKGGALETVLPGKTGLFYEKQTSESLLEAIQAFEEMESTFDPQAIRAHAETFSKARFQREFKAFVEGKLNICR
jgi:glycosyltransferase involved in cell wall biosynthesis